ncbi:MAG TPA: protease pro-enzyme activation domain-containing protein, partial [Caulobacteraceae bacterium]
MASFSLNGSERHLPLGARDMGPAPPDQQAEVSILLRRANDLAPTLARLAQGDRMIITREAFAERFGATAADAQAVEAFAARFGLVVMERDLARRTVRLAGAVNQFCQAFGVDLRRMDGPVGAFRGRTGAVRLPDEMAGIVEAVLGLDNRPQARTHHRLFRPEMARAAGSVSYTPLQVAALYGFPAGDGAGETIALIELGGGFAPA